MLVAQNRLNGRQDVAFDGSDEEFVSFYGHVAVCAYHKAMVEAANSEFQLNLIRFNSRLKASQEPNNQGRVITYGPAERSVSANGKALRRVSMSRFVYAALLMGTGIRRGSNLVTVKKRRNLHEFGKKLCSMTKVVRRRILNTSLSARTDDQSIFPDGDEWGLNTNVLPTTASASLPKMNAVIKRIARLFISLHYHGIRAEQVNRRREIRRSIPGSALSV